MINIFLIKLFCITKYIYILYYYKHINIIYITITCYFIYRIYMNSHSSVMFSAPTKHVLIMDYMFA